MGWMNRQGEEIKEPKLTKEQLKEAGLDVDDLTTKLNTFATMQTSITEMQGKLNTVDAIKAGLDDIASKLSAKSTPPNKEEGDTPPTQEEELDFLMKPEESIKKMISKEVGGTNAAVMALMADNMWNNFKSTNPRGWSAIEPKIKEMWDKQPLQNKINPEMIKNIYKIVAMDNLDLVNSSSTTSTVERGQSGAPHTNADGTKKKAEDVLTKDQLDIATKWGMTPQEYYDEALKDARTQYA